MEKTLKITEAFNSRGYSDISSVYADLAEPEYVNEHYTKKCDYFSDFSNHYAPRKARDFIEKLDFENPGKYIGYRIVWSDSN